MIAIVTAITGGRDELKRPVVEARDISYICYADEPWRYRGQGWEVRKLEPQIWTLNQCRRASRAPKILSHQYSDGAEVTIWIDACAQPLADPREFIRLALGDANDVAVIRHERLDVRTEQAFCRDKRVGDQTAIARQLNRYEADGFPGAPFVCGGLIARRENANVRAFNEQWWWEYASGQERDQFALAYALWKKGVKLRLLTPGEDFPGVNIWDNPWFGWHKHASRCQTGTGRTSG